MIRCGQKFLLLPVTPGLSLTRLPQDFVYRSWSKNKLGIIIIIIIVIRWFYPSTNGGLFPSSMIIWLPMMGLAHVFHILSHDHLAMDQYLLIPFLVGWTSIYQLFWCSPGVQGFDTSPFANDLPPSSFGHLRPVTLPIQSPQSPGSPGSASSSGMDMSRMRLGSRKTLLEKNHDMMGNLSVDDYDDFRLYSILHWFPMAQSN